MGHHGDKLRLHLIQFLQMADILENRDRSNNLTKSSVTGAVWARRNVLPTISSCETEAYPFSFRLSVSSISWRDRGEIALGEGLSGKGFLGMSSIRIAAGFVRTIYCPDRRQEPVPMQWIIVLILDFSAATS